MSNHGRRRFGNLRLHTLLCLAALYGLGSPVHAINICGSINGTLSTAGNPWLATCDIAVEVGDTLIIDPGVELRFKTGTIFKILGNLEAIGTVAQPITFRSNKATPLPGDYGTIEVSGKASITHASLLHGKG